MAGGGGVLLTAAAELPLVTMLVSLLTMVSGVTVTRFAFGGVTAPLVGPAGPQAAVPLGVVTLAAALLGLVGYAVLRRPGVAVAAPQCPAAM
ncbi:hypothetical protein [Rhodococcus sp. 14C212]|uniref:hypothetical protein n=1 Tax=Rhodococcus sp. 14C212 TaxID=2711209 RepID=UPI001F0E7102|nr:hypothetical protein [Rhodococcus sp. 14C212]